MKRGARVRDGVLGVRGEFWLLGIGVKMRS